MKLTAHDVILRPVVTEQAARLTEQHNKYTFRVHRDANKIQIRDAVQTLFNVKVKKVRTINMPAKRKGGLRVRTPGVRSPWKKAIVALAPGDKIDLV